ncbi:MAG TPA: LysR substrate-binding domain-containing protein [Xanthobacteraceae bacterium]|nr:LysR substrate-binding domain-containing protein [Xanthobacteraceae bacterium]
MDAADLKFFAAVAKVGGMNRAASKLNTVQSNVTARVRTLEEELGVALFHRGHNGVTLTAAGERLLPYAIKVTHLLDEARKAVKDDGEPRGRLTIGSLETNAALRLLPVIASYSQAFPDVDLVLRSGTTHELIAQVLAHTVEGAFVCGPVDHQDLVEEVFFREELVVLTARTVRSLDDVTRKGDVKIVVHHQGCAYRQILENLLIKRGVVGIRHLEFGTLETIYRAVSAGLGITLLPRSLIGSMWRDNAVSVHGLPEAESRITTVFVHRQDALMSSALKEFLKLARPTPLRMRAAE